MHAIQVTKEQTPSRTPHDLGTLMPGQIFIFSGALYVKLDGNKMKKVITSKVSEGCPDNVCYIPSKVTWTP